MSTENESEITALREQLNREIELNKSQAAEIEQWRQRYGALSEEHEKRGLELAKAHDDTYRANTRVADLSKTIRDLQNR